MLCLREIYEINKNRENSVMSALMFDFQKLLNGFSRNSALYTYIKTYEQKI